eukprot:GDKH01002665.1.p1 GENE.GDKH01002665.1~~GDKH01002665.1.p1  ORF type:complete len:127 (-),score=1.05 GDKH01002665.1:31-411(-)
MYQHFHMSNMTHCTNAQTHVQLEQGCFIQHGMHRFDKRTRPAKVASSCVALGGRCRDRSMRLISRRVASAPQVRTFVPARALSVGRGRGKERVHSGPHAKATRSGQVEETTDRAAAPRQPRPQSRH